MKKFVIFFLLILIVAAGLWIWKTSNPAGQPVANTPVPPAVPAQVSAKEDKMPTRAAAGAVPSASDTAKSLDLSKDPNGENYVKENAQSLWQVDPASLSFEKRDNGERVKLSYIQKFNGLPIFGARLSLFVEGQAVSRVQNNLNSYSQVDGDFTLSASQAEDKLKEQSWKVEAPAEPLFFPFMQRLRPAYRVMASRGEKSSDVIVDAVDGRTIRVIPRTHY